MKLGILTSGGDCPGLNAVIRAVVRKAIKDCNIEPIGILRGWRGLIDGLVMPLDMEGVSGILPRGGTILRTSRTNPFIHARAPEQIAENAKRFGLDGVIAIGGDDSMTVAHRLYAEQGIKIVGVPKAIDNDVWGTEYCFGFDTTVNISMEAIDRLHTTAESHDRVMVVEVMGRDTGWIALYAGISGGADMILIPEIPVGLDEVIDLIRHRHDRGKDFSIIVVAEGCQLRPTRDAVPKRVTEGPEQDEFGHDRLGGVGKALSEEIERQTGYETRVTVLGHIQRGGSPSAFDRVLGTRFGVAATELLAEGKGGVMVASQADKIVPVPLGEVADKIRTVPPELYKVASPFFG
jgi:ATP-dependent phosphofructokinase / diphosphate-dependent phosphofructokinase